MKRFITSYKDLPAYPYQFQTKFRNELRSKSGLMRGREFLMKDLYSFSVSREEHEKFYDRAAEAYMEIFSRLGIGDITYKTFASGGSFSKYSHEFQTISEVGEDMIYIDEAKKMAVNEEVYTDEVLAEIGLHKDGLVSKKAVEVGNIFTLGTKYSDALDLKFTDDNGQQQPVFMGSYGIGPSRLMGLLAEHFADDRGLVWPVNVAPFKVYIARLGDSQAAVKQADELYDLLTSKQIEVIYDDRDLRAGEKFADADLLGIPYRVVVSDKTASAGSYEFKSRISQEASNVSGEELLKKLA
jgi:prolyl-tRNA synthetase